MLSSPHLEGPKYSITEYCECDLTYAIPLYVTAELQNYETGEIESQTMFIGDFPLMTEHGAFIINDTERVAVSQLARLPSVCRGWPVDKTSNKNMSNTKVVSSHEA